MQHTPFRLSRLAELCEGTLEGDDIEITGAGGLAEAGAGDVTFVRAGLAPDALARSSAGAVIVAPDFPDTGRPTVRHENPRFAFALALGLLVPPERPAPGVHATAAVDPGADLGEGVSVGPLAVIEAGATIGAGSVVGPHAVVGRRARVGRDCRIDAHAIIYRDCIVGDRVTLFAGAVVGCDGFGFEAHGGQIHRLPHIGITVIEDDVEIGAGSCVDRATTGRTVVGAGTKIDNQVMVGHNCRIGRSSLIAGQSGFAGSCVVGDGVVVGGGSSIADHVVIEDGATLGGRSGVASRVPAAAVWSGNPAREHRGVLREAIALPKLPGLLKEFRELRRQVERLQKRLEETST